MAAYDDIVRAANHPHVNATSVLRVHIEEDQLYPGGTRDVIELRDDGRLIVSRIRLRPLLARLVALGAALNGSTVAILTAIIALVLQARTSEPLTQDASQICLLLAGQDAVDREDLFARAATRLAAEQRTLTREHFAYLLDQLETNKIVRVVDSKVELAETLSL
jgi:hypothetical protein